MRFNALLEVIKLNQEIVVEAEMESVIVAKYWISSIRNANEKLPGFLLGFKDWYVKQINISETGNAINIKLEEHIF